MYPWSLTFASVPVSSSAPAAAWLEINAAKPNAAKRVLRTGSLHRRLHRRDNGSRYRRILQAVKPKTGLAIAFGQGVKCLWSTRWAGTTHKREIEMDDRAIRSALERHWAASDASDFDAEHEIYREDAVLSYPQSGELIRGRRNIQESRTVQPNKKRFTVRRILGGGDLWITEFILSYDDKPSYTVSIMEF